MTTFTSEEKLKEIDRELAKRNSVYPFLISRGKLTAKAAQRQQAILQAIRQDYADRAKEGPLFAAAGEANNAI